MTDPTIFRCPACHSAPLVAMPGTLSCGACGKTFPMEGGVPLLVADLAAHEGAMAQARAVNPDWYRTEQPPEAASPWRHHLKKRRHYVTSVLKRELAQRGRARAPRLLDLGCGDGTNLLWLKDFAENLYGSDYNPVRLARAHARSPEATLFLADILDYPAVDGCFDVVFFNHVIEHIPDDGAALATAYRILAPGGLLILGTPNEGSWWWQLAYRRAPEIRRTTDHVHFYTAESIREKMRQAGFSVFEVEHMGWGPPDWHLDGKWRQHKWVDDLFEILGRTLVPNQASSLYLLATK
ncbi:class I SAM-dependent methyltransferase [Sulfurisoma sediminicola]|uniref:Ubiquinone/menaquinone biosynthesis C-methylase UbiE n=1 Tax=Sulfurisoma sediminicola TaxID=1381557 RepID=A0A497XKT4_9PROT|nr:class I SAM-dependent methyltransferase [Sulfurisoma sediminicola]RLJ68000.1 ubiquinone/menaquinone biosynthesis C-methylase UbiE [Sulfurisoma sediminicola]